MNIKGKERRSAVKKETQPARPDKKCVVSWLHGGEVLGERRGEADHGLSSHGKILLGLAKKKSEEREEVKLGQEKKKPDKRMGVQGKEGVARTGKRRTSGSGGGGGRTPGLPWGSSVGKGMVGGSPRPAEREKGGEVAFSTKRGDGSPP